MIIHRFNRFLYNDANPAGDGGGDGGSPPPSDPAPPAGEPAAGDPQPPIPPTNQRPEWFPEKYWKDGGPADVETLGKSYTELQKAFSAKNPHLAEVPDSPDGYAFKPEKLPEGVQWSDDAAKHFAPVFHTAQIGNGQAKAITQALVDFEAANLAAATKAYEEKIAADTKTLTEKWGGEEAFTAKRDGIAALITDQLGEHENDATLFTNPRIVEFLGKTVDYIRSMESQLGEDALAKAKGSTAPGSPQFTSGAAEASRIMSDPTHPQHEAYLKGDVEVQKRVLAMLGGA